MKSKARTQPNADGDVQQWQSSLVVDGDAGCRIQPFGTLGPYYKTEHTVTIEPTNCAPVYIPK